MHNLLAPIGDGGSETFRRSSIHGAASVGMIASRLMPSKRMFKPIFAGQPPGACFRLKLGLRNGMANTANLSLFSERLFTGTLMQELSGSGTAMNA